jgi:hypothetical protein
VTIETAYLQDLPIRTRVKHSDRVLPRRQRRFAGIECEWDARVHFPGAVGLGLCANDENTNEHHYR